ncbi:MAG: hypothetical protein ABIH68_06165 [bacterium]
MKKKVFLLLVLFLCADYASAVGLSTKFSMAIIENIFPGESYNIRKLVNLPYLLTNTSPFPVTGAIVVDIPVKEMLIMGYEPVPDTDWVEISERTFDLGAGESILVDIIIFVPDKEEYYGKSYQVSIESCGRGAGGNIAAGLVSKVCFTTVKSKSQREMVAEQDRLLANLNYEVLPDRIRVRNVKPGKKYELGKDFQKFFKIVNMNEIAYTYKVRSVTRAQSKLEKQKDFEETPDPSFISFEKETVEVPDNTVQKLKIFLKIPKEEEHYGKRYQFYIEVTLTGQAIPVKKFSFVYVDTAEK